MRSHAGSNHILLNPVHGHSLLIPRPWAKDHSLHVYIP